MIASRLLKMFEVGVEPVQVKLIKKYLKKVKEHYDSSP